MINFKSAYSLSVIRLTIAGVLWGLSFTCVKWGLLDFTTSQLLLWRFLLAFAIGEIGFFIYDKVAWKNSHKDILLSIKPGFFLGLSLLFQIHGLHFTTATNSGFITSMYVILIPLISFIFFKHKINITHFILAIIAFLGMGFLLQLNISQLITGEKTFFSYFNFGDFLTLGAAITAAFQIIYIGQTSPKSVHSFRYNNYQTFWCLFLIVPFYFYEKRTLNISLWPDKVSFLSITGLVLLIFFVSLLAFYLQVRAQKDLPTTTASMLCLLEGPFSFIFASLFLAETLSPLQIMGTVLILISSSYSVYIESRN